MGTYYAQVKGYKNANNATTCYTLKVALGTVSKPTDNELVLSDKKVVDVYPNPAQNVVSVNITGYAGTSEIRVFDINGRQIIAKKTNQVTTQLDVSRLMTGIYLVKVINGDTVISTRKVVKK